MAYCFYFLFSEDVTSGGHDETDFLSQAQASSQAELEIARFLRNAPPDTVKQTINVEREEEEIIGPMPLNHADGSDTGPDGLLNFDTVSEKVDLGVKDGKAQLAVKVRCERIVPIKGVEDIFKKSSVIVTRLIQIDLDATDETRSLYEHIMRNNNQGMIEAAPSGGSGKRRNKVEKRLSTKETFNLYKTFMGMAEHDEATRKTKIEHRIEDERHPPADAHPNMVSPGSSHGNPPRRPPSGRSAGGHSGSHSGGHSGGHSSGHKSRGHTSQHHRGGHGDVDYDNYGNGVDLDDDEGPEFDTHDLERRLEEQMVDKSRSRGGGSKLEAMPGGRGHVVKDDSDTMSYISHADSMIY